MIDLLKRVLSNRPATACDNDIIVCAALKGAFGSSRSSNSRSCFNRWRC